MQPFVKNLLVLLLLYVAAQPLSARTDPEAQMREDVEMLCSEAFGGRSFNSGGTVLPSMMLARRFAEAGLSPLPSGRYQCFRDARGRCGRNVAGCLKGKGPGTVVIAAYYDGLGRLEGRLYPCADANASGVAMLLCLARRISDGPRPENTLIFVALDAHHSGNAGAAAFLESLPQAIETEHYIFAHAAVRPDKPLRAHSVDELTRCDAFLQQGWRFDKWVIVGHYPVVLYGRDTVCANPVIDRDSHIISIDGGCVLKDDGQLNALVIPFEGSEDFDFVAYDDFPVMTVQQAQAPSARSYYIRWGDNRVQVLRRGEEFSLCRHVRTGYEMEILTKYLYSDGEFTDCNDCTDDVLELERGDRVSVIERTSRGFFVKHKGRSGWYFGELA